jgi:hypothetical protein
MIHPDPVPQMLLLSSNSYVPVNDSHQHREQEANEQIAEQVDHVVGKGEDECSTVCVT